MSKLYYVCWRQAGAPWQNLSFEGLTSAAQVLFDNAERGWNCYMTTTVDELSGRTNRIADIDGANKWCFVFHEATEEQRQVIRAQANRRGFSFVKGRRSSFMGIIGGEMANSVSGAATVELKTHANGSGPTCFGGAAIWPHITLQAGFQQTDNPSAITSCYHELCLVLERYGFKPE